MPAESFWAMPAPVSIVNQEELVVAANETDDADASDGEAASPANQNELLAAANETQAGGAGVARTADINAEESKRGSAHSLAAAALEDGAEPVEGDVGATATTLDNGGGHDDDAPLSTSVSFTSERSVPWIDLPGGRATFMGPMGGMSLFGPTAFPDISLRQSMMPAHPSTEAVTAPKKQPSPSPEAAPLSPLEAAPLSPLEAAPPAPPEAAPPAPPEAAPPAPPEASN